MARNRKYQDFRNLQDYRLALLILRKFAPAKFAAGAGYDLRQWRDLDSIPKSQSATIRKYYRQIRPLLTYGYSPRKIVATKKQTKKQAKNKLDSQYRSLYGITPLPGIIRIPLPLDKQGNKVPVIFKKNANGDLIAGVVIRPGIQVVRMTWEQMGYTWDDIAPENIRFTLAEIWQKYQPDYMGTIAGTSRVKADGVISFRNDPDTLAEELIHIQARYGRTDDPDQSPKGAGRNPVNWLDGLELYYFYPPGGKRGRDHVKAAELRQWRKDEKKRYDDRTKLSNKLKNVNKSIRDLKRDLIRFEKILTRTKTKAQRETDLKQYHDEYYDKRLILLVERRDKLTVQLHLTKGF